MTTHLVAAAAVAVPWLVGATLIWVAVRQVPQRGNVALALGLGFPAGMALIALLTYVVLRLGLPNPAVWATSALFVLTLILVWRFRRYQPQPPPALLRTSVLGWAVIVALSVAVVAHWYLLWGELNARPVFPWDAWSAWGVKAKIWFYLQEYVPVVGFSEWLRAPEGAIRTNDAAHYPAMLPLIQLWMAWTIGEWNEPLILLPWLMLPPSLFLMAYGACLSCTNRLGALVVAYALTSLPLIQAHAALAGYADLWLALAVCAAVISLCIHRRSPSITVAVVFFGFVFLFAFIKLEGIVWAFILLAVAALSPLRARSRLAVAMAAVALVAVWWLFGGFEIPVGEGRSLVLTTERIGIAEVDTFNLGYTNTAPAFAFLLHLGRSWHLLWYLLPAAIAVLLWRRAGSRLAPVVGTLTLLTAVFVVGLFFFTDASAWAKDYTSGNRILLHVALGLSLSTALLYFDQSSES